MKSTSKRIVKNTFYLYLRMFISMVIGLYTSRVVLQTLGVEDFGIYNVVGGVVVLFTFINSAMTASTQRFLSYELGVENGDIRTIFSACVNIHSLLILIVLIFAETIGLWFLNYRMNFPPERMGAVNWVYQLSLLTCLLNIIRVPYNALIIAYERMSFYAYISILEALSKLIVVFGLLYIPSDKLVVYALMMTSLTGCINFSYYLYCKYKLCIRYTKTITRTIYKKLFSFSVWTLFGSIANVGLQQGLNIIVNIFYGVTFNAALGIANQVNSHIMTFVNGFQQALNPQLTKLQASNDNQNQFLLICRSSKFSFYIMFFISFPILVNLDIILHYWLGDYPEYSINFCRLIIIGALIETLSGPLWVTIFATGKIKYYQIIISIVLLLNVPFSYFIGKFGLPAETMYTCRNILYVVALVTRLLFLYKLIDFNVKAFIKNVVLPIGCVSLLFLFVISYVPSEYYLAKDFIELVYISVVIVLIEASVIYIVGLNKIERSFILGVLKRKKK